MSVVDDVRAALARVPFPGYQRDIVAFGMVRDVDVRDGRTVVLIDPGTADVAIVNELRARIARAVADVGGLDAVDVRIAGADAGRAAACNPFDESAPLPGVRDIVA